MSEVVLKDHSIHEPTTAHIHPLETIPQGTQADGVLNGHDHRDVDAKILAWCFLGLVALIIFSFVSMAIMTGGMLGALQKGDTVPSSTYAERPTARSAWPVKRIDTPLQTPREMPVLHPDPEIPNVELREEDDAALENYNWAKDDKGRRTGVTVPIDRAIDLTVERGLPSDNRSKATVQKPTGETPTSGSIPFSQRYMRDHERSKNGMKTKAGNGKEEMRSREIRPQTAIKNGAMNGNGMNSNGMTNGAASNTVDEDGRTLGIRRSPY